MSWKYKGVEINTNEKGYFYADLTKGKQEIRVEATTLEGLHPLIEKALARTKKDNLALQCLAYMGPRADIVAVVALGVSGTDSSFRLDPPVHQEAYGPFQLYPNHPAVQVLLEQLHGLEEDLERLKAKLKPIQLLTLGHGRQDLSTMEALGVKLTERYHAALKVVENL